MSLDGLVLLTLLGMALATYATRVAGFAIVVRLPLSPGTKRFLERIPGTTFAALTAPLVIAGGPPEWLAAVVTLAVLRFGGNVFLAVLSYPCAVAAYRAFAPFGS